MMSLSQDNQVFIIFNLVDFSDNTIHKIKEDLRQLMSELWVNWTHLGVDMNTKISNINKFIQIEKDFHNEVMTETRLKMSKLQEIIESW